MSKYDGITFKIETFTVDKAKLALTRNKSNRPLNQDNVTFICSEMKQKKWMFTGESIIFGKNGDLMNGQHRLEAIIITGIEQDFLTVRGVNNDAFKCIDTGKMRSAGDVLSIMNVINPHSFASIARFIISFNRGGYEKAAGKMSNRKLKITNHEIADFVTKRLTSMTESREYGFVPENSLVAGNLLSALHYIFKQINYDAACDFCKKLADGKELEKNDPVFVLRAELLQSIRSNRPMTRLEEIGLICKAWNFYRQNKKINVIKYDIIKDEFPKPI